jgi:hypothetical protein
MIPQALLRLLAVRLRQTGRFALPSLMGASRCASSWLLIYVIRNNLTLDSIPQFWLNPKRDL